MTGERGIVDMVDVESFVEKCFDAVKHLSRSHGSG